MHLKKWPLSAPNHMLAKKTDACSDIESEKGERQTDKQTVGGLVMVGEWDCSGPT